jgi:hypothetical protein
MFIILVILIILYLLFYLNSNKSYFLDSLTNEPALMDRHNYVIKQNSSVKNLDFLKNNK